MLKTSMPGLLLNPEARGRGEGRRIDFEGLDETIKLQKARLVKIIAGIMCLNFHKEPGGS